MIHMTKKKNDGEMRSKYGQPSCMYLSQNKLSSGDHMHGGKKTETSLFFKVWNLG